MSVKSMVEKPRFREERESHNSTLRSIIAEGEIDAPLVPLLRKIIQIPCCFTVQSCYGHFLHEREPDEKNLAPLAPYRGVVTGVRYRLAYMVFCIERSGEGFGFCRDLQALPSLCPGYIQFGCAGWFWDMMANTYVVQVEPAWGSSEDSISVDFEEALTIESVRALFFDNLLNIAKRYMVAP